MALTIETGALIAGADSYISLTDARAYAAAQGLTLSGVDATAELSLRRACEYLETYRDRFSGVKVSGTQSLQWPRDGASLDGFDLAITDIPVCLQRAQVRIACAIEAGADPLPTSDGRVVKRLKVEGAVETEWEPGSAPSVRPIFAAAEALLEGLFGSSGGGSWSMTVDRA